MTILSVLALIIGFVAVIVIINYFSTWLQACASGAHISFMKLIGMSLRKIPSGLIVRHYIQLRKAGITNVSTDDLEGHYMAHGHIDKVVNASVPSKPEETVWDEGEAVKLHFDNEAALVVAS